MGSLFREKSFDLTNESFGSWFVFQQQMIFAFQSDKARVGYFRRKIACRFPRYPLIAPGMQYQGRHINRRKLLAHVDIAKCRQECAGIFRTGGQPLKFVEPCQLFRRCTRHESGGEQVPISRIFAAPSRAS